MNKSESKYFNTAKKMNLALISLLKKKPLEYITISELCETAGVNRSTFYLHYENTCDLLDETTRYLLDNFLSYFTNNTRAIAFNLLECELDELNFISNKYLTPYLTYIKDNKEIFLTALSHVRSFGFDSVYKRMFENIFNPILDRFHYPEEDRKYVMMYYLNGINAISFEWLKEDCNKSIEDISKIIIECIFGLNNTQ
ncbi:TetR/AcrR family transcriptional regulator [Acetivibrio sp. MSJd-27]|uniref:TetR/AcrR family transcriptional regulator n=1 Tax=Acetivibrio sp. MSJd-27 TaxID=2841523 RepID=UPI001C112167|nr:TetR/AcrR family transcriptional regulator [Acetivibrio sp. MSJd-27]MBU5450117.1 TetR/AcrR family transcriptional regulator [Acetivibrio sp. MSJd-27]